MRTDSGDRVYIWDLAATVRVHGYNILSERDDIDA
jgi:hypothetical protein